MYIYIYIYIYVYTCVNHIVQYHTSTSGAHRGPVTQGTLSSGSSPRAQPTQDGATGVCEQTTLLWKRMHARSI